MKNNFYVAIMAGGIGSRFWPKSREHYPKQFLDILGTGQTLIQATYERFKAIVPEDHIYIVTGEAYKELVKEQLPTVQDFQIVAEPKRCNTGPCVAYIAHKLSAKDPNATFVVAPSDHLVTDTPTFVEVVQKGLTFAAKNKVLLTLGIKPHRPHTGYGYIQYDDDKQAETGIYEVKTFTEKPSKEIAQTFFESGDFLWNSGIFIWSASTIIRSFAEFQPDVYHIFQEGNDQYNTPAESSFIAKAYEKTKSISIDYAIMEHAKNVLVIPTSFGWSDLGTWLSLWEKHPKDYLNNSLHEGNVVTYDCTDCIVKVPKNKLVVLQGLEQYCVVDTNDVLLVCRMDNDKLIKSITGDIQKRADGKKYL